MFDNGQCKPETEHLQQQFQKRWFALRTRPHHEKAVRDRLKKNGYEELLPVVFRTSQWSDRTKEIESALFPGYCFVRIERQWLIDVIQVPGVCYVVGCGDQPESIPDVEIEGLRRLMMSRISYMPHQRLSEGSLVEIASGPLAGLRGRLIREDGSPYVVIGVELINLGARVKVQMKDVVPVIEPSPKLDAAMCLSENLGVGGSYNRKRV